jgi:uncharacterized repeat protein (TIGR03803 family)
MRTPFWSAAIRVLAIAAALVPGLAGCGGSAGVPTTPGVTGSDQRAGGSSTAAHRPQPTETVLYNFGSVSNDGRDPRSTPRYIRGALFGTTESGGTNDLGTVFSVTTSGSESVVHSFGSSNDGVGPDGGLTASGYGVTRSGGTYGYGTVYRILPSGSETVLYSFGGSRLDGFHPVDGLIELNGTLYGTTRYGGTHGVGTVYSISPFGEERVLYNFAGGSDGIGPGAVLTSVDGTLYGTTQFGGTNDAGTVFSVTTAGSETTLYSFKGGTADGKRPRSGLTRVGSALYGFTSEGGTTNNYGTVFKVTLTGTETILHRFASGADGADPQYGRLLLVNGLLYGTTRQGGAHNTGTVYSITPQGAESVVYSFGTAGGSDGHYPFAGLTNVGGVLYGTTSQGGAHGLGTVFALTP